ncbi:MAG: hypothetical protein Q9175_000625 [Cornicularia normoerica]
MSPMGLRALKEGLAQNLGKLMPSIIDEVSYSLDKELPPCKDWTPVNVYDSTTLIAATVGSRIMTGPELGHNQDWIKLLLAYTKDVISCAIWLKGLPHVARITVLNFLPPVRRLRRHYATAHRMAIPIMEARKKACLGTKSTKPNDLMQWISDRAAAEGNTYDFKHQAQLQLSAGLASIWSTSKTCTHNLYDLAYRKEYIETLRQEIIEVLAEEDGHLTKQGLAKMKKLDSFMKESQRVNPAGFVTWDRQTLRPLNLKDGTHIPKGTYLALPVADTPTNQSLISDPETFDPWRFYSLRSRSAEDGDRFQFTSTDVRYSHFGYGKHACPGRFFAGQQIKATLALIIRDFDIKLQDGVSKRPANWVYGLHAVPDPKVKVLFKRR